MGVFEGTFSFIPRPIEIYLYLVPQPTELINHLQNWHGILFPCTDQTFTEYKECSIDVFQNKFLTLVTIKTLLERKQSPTE